MSFKRQVNLIGKVLINLKNKKLGILGVVGMILVSTLLTNSAYADYDQSFYANNGIYWYNPDATSCSTGSSSATTASTSTVTSLQGSTNEQKVYNYFVTQGLTSTQAAGIAGGLQGESAVFNPFQEENGDPWPTEGYGIAQFTGGQRTAIKDSLTASLGASVFNQYYVATYDSTSNPSGVPTGVPQDINDKFLLGELNYLYGYISGFAPSTIPLRVSDLQADFGLTIPSGMKLLNYIQTLKTTQDVAAAWTYLYEFPGGIHGTALARGADAAAILSSAGVPSSASSATAAGSGCTTTGNASSVISCPSSTGSSSITTGDGSVTAMVSTAKCLTYQPAAGQTSSQAQGKAACSNGGCAHGPTTPANYAAARVQYKTAGTNGTNQAFDTWGADCGNFVATVMRMSGVDPSYSISDVGALSQHMASEPSKYQNMGTTTSTANLQPGDILVEGTMAHIMIYIGNGNVAQASQDQEMPVQEGFWVQGSPWTIWRVKA